MYSIGNISISSALTNSEDSKGVCKIQVPNSEWEETEDYMYMHQGESLRTRVSFSADTLQPSVSTLHKKQIQTLTLCSHIYDIRISLALEEPKENPNILIMPQHVRFKQTKNIKSLTSPYIISCNMVWSGSTATEAEKIQASGEPIMELECEVYLHSDKDYVATHSSRHIAKSILMKSVNLMLDDHVVFTPVR